MEKETKILVFNAGLQKETEHVLDIDGAGEIVLTCTETGRVLKFPKGTTGAELKVLLAEHKAVNEGDITVEAIEEQKAKLIEDLDLDEESV